MHCEHYISVCLNILTCHSHVCSPDVDDASDKDKTDFLNELSILKQVGKHENVVCLVGACHIRGIMEFLLGRVWA